MGWTQFKILDCTLRDGGYYNNWDFNKELVQSYLNAMALSKIEYVELGLRNFARKGFLGPFAYTTEDFLATLALPEGPSYGVMVDAKTILESGFNVEEALGALFVEKKDSFIDFVRVATHFNDIEKCKVIVKKLNSMGYLVGLNLMQAAGKPTELINHISLKVESWKTLDVLYFADSIGNMDSEEVNRICDALRYGWKGEIGIHTHNNMGRGLSNSISAIQKDISWIDATVSGMGRGAGNTQTETLLAFSEGYTKRYSPSPIYEIVIKNFESLQKKYGWGTNLMYYLGAQKNIHPTYIQTLLSNPHFDKDVMVGAIDYLCKIENSASYDQDILNDFISFNGNTTAPVVGQDVTNLLINQNVLIVASGPSTNKHRDAIERYIRKNSPVVISLIASDIQIISEEMIDYYVILHNSKFLSDSKKYQHLDKPFILPKHRFSADELELIVDKKTIDYGVEIKQFTFANKGFYGVIPYDITIAYLLAFLLDARPNLIECVGFDGFGEGDKRQFEMLDLLDKYLVQSNAIKLTSLTPTSYPIEERSVYAPHRASLS
jgi:4-hydroxy 2-oxovalerate aldolase